MGFPPWAVWKYCFFEPLYKCSMVPEWVIKFSLGYTTPHRGEDRNPRDLILRRELQNWEDDIPRAEHHSRICALLAVKSVPHQKIARFWEKQCQMWVCSICHPAQNLLAFLKLFPFVALNLLFRPQNITNLYILTRLIPSATIASSSTEGHPLHLMKLLTLMLLTRGCFHFIRPNVLNIPLLLLMHLL